MGTDRSVKTGLKRAAGLPLLLLVCLVNLLVLYLCFPDTRIEAQAGSILAEDLRYPFSGTDAFRTDELRQIARDRTEPVYLLDSEAVTAAERNLDDWFAQYDLFLREMTLRWEEGAQEYNGFLYNQTAWNVLVRETELQSKLNEFGLSDALDTAMAYTILNTYLPRSSLHAAGAMPDSLPLKTALSDAILKGMEGGVKESELETARYRAKEQLKQTSLPAVSKTELAGHLIDKFFTVSAVVDQVETELARAAAANQVIPVTVKKGDVILRAGTTLTERDVVHLVSLGMIRADDSGWAYGGYLMYLLPIYLVFGLYLLLFEGKTALSPGTMGRLCLLLGLELIVVWGFTLFERRVAPLLFGTLMIAATHEKRTALGANALIALTDTLLLSDTGPLTGDTLWYMVGALVMGTVAVGLMKGDARRSGSTLVAAVAGGVLGGLVMAVPHVLNGDGLLLSFMAFGLSFIGALIALLLSLALTPLWENLFGLPSQTKLNELLSADHPLQRRLMNSASGTYHHCQMTALLAESGAKSIGANALLAKAAAAVHDVGKLRSPRNFSENQANGVNPHDQMAPSESARIIIAHVADGDTILRRYRVPEALREIVREHHGTTMTAYFYMKAKKMGEDVVETDFRYPGPRPSSRESAIVLLADSCEAAVRSLGGPSPEQVRDMVRRVFRGKMEDGQLMNSDLTLNELSRVEEAFLRTLAGILHDRITYPEEEP